MSKNPKIKPTNENKEKYGVPIDKIGEYKIVTPKEFSELKNPDDGVLPIDRIENEGYRILKNKEGQIEVRVGKTDNLLEGNNSYRDEGLDELRICYVDKDDIVDYDSLWVMTQSGWDGDNLDRPDYPYICVNGKWWRWDNHKLRLLCGIRKWTSENYVKFQIFCMKNGKDKMMGDDVLMVTEMKPITRGKKKIGRNEDCPCGSGLRYKRCCLLNPSGIG